MESASGENPKAIDRARISSSTSSNQLFIADNFELGDDTFRMSLDSYTVIGENVTVGERDPSIDSGSACMAAETPASTPVVETPETPVVEPFTPPAETTLPIVDTPKPPNLLKLSLKKHNEDNFVRPSPVQEVMSPARMLQFEVDVCATPTMKRAVIDFDFFKQNKFEEYFDDQSKKEDDNGDTPDQESVAESTDKPFKETPVIVKTDTVRHEIGFVGNLGVGISSNVRFRCHLEGKAKLASKKLGVHVCTCTLTLEKKKLLVSADNRRSYGVHY